MLKKILRVLSVAVISFFALYWIGVNAILASPLGPHLMNLRPDMVQIHYVRAWTFIPGILEVRGFELSMQDRLVQISLSADSVKGNLNPWTLARQKFLATQVEADGVTMRVRPRMDKGDPMVKDIDLLPPIIGYETPIRDVSANEVDAKDIRFLSLEFKDLTVHHLRELWIDRLHYTGDAEVSGGMLYEPFRRMRIDDGLFIDATSKMVAGNPDEIAFETLEVRITTPELNLQTMDFASMRGITADINLSAIAEPRFMNSYLENVAGLSTLSAGGKPGKLEVALRIDLGVIADGGELSYRTPQVKVRLPLVEVSGAAVVKGKASNGKLALDVAISNAALRQRDGTQLIDADRFSLEATSSTDLTKLPDVDAALVLGGGHVKALTAMNQFIPPGAGVSLASGKGQIDGWLKLDTSSARGRGKFDLVATDVTVKNRAASLKGKLSVHGEIKSMNLNSGVLDISGSSISLDGATLQAQGRSWPHMWLKAVADPCIVNPKGKEQWNTTLSVGSSNLQPLLAMVSASVPVPQVLTYLTDSPNVRAQATIVVTADAVELSKLSLTSQNIRMEGAVSLREAARFSDEEPKLEPWGNVLAHAGVFNAGVQLDGPKLVVVLTDLERWSVERKLVAGPRKSN